MHTVSAGKPEEIKSFRKSGFPSEDNIKMEPK
jgi:hypothetical protein